MPAIMDARKAPATRHYRKALRAANLRLVEIRRQHPVSLGLVWGSVQAVAQRGRAYFLARFRNQAGEWVGTTFLGSVPFKEES